MSVSSPTRFWQHPATVWLLVLAAVFATEYSVMLALPWILPGDSLRFLDATVDAIALTVLLAPLLWWTAVRPLREVIRLRARFLSNLITRLEGERRRVAHELHDGVGQSLSLLVSGLRSAHESISDPDLAGRCQRLLDLAQGALRDVKCMALGLRPALLDDLGLAPALERLVADIRRSLPIDVELEAADLAGQRFPEAVETAVFRIVQEALANVMQHAQARSARVVVRRADGALTLSITDDGQGFEQLTESAAGTGDGHLGLIGMRERATLLGGRFQLVSHRGKGTRITATIPLERS